VDPEALAALAPLIAAALSLPSSAVTLELSSDGVCTADRSAVPPQASAVPRPPLAPINSLLGAGLYPPRVAGFSNVPGSIPASGVGRADLQGGDLVSAPVLTALSPIQVVAAGGVDGPACGSVTSPCATLRYAVNVLANVVTPVSAPVPVVLGPGVFGPASCGAHATRPVNITGAGSITTTVDCRGSDRALSASDSVWLAGITFTGGFANVSVAAADVGGGPSVYTGGGGGAVAVLWAASSGFSAELTDLVFVNNSVVVVVAEGAASNAVVGGGGLFLAGGSNISAVLLQRVSFLRNSVAVTDWSDYAASCGGGACIAVGAPSSPATESVPVADVSLTVVEIAALDNIVNSSCPCDSAHGGWQRQGWTRFRPWREQGAALWRDAILFL
jgi:hypothetical protein